jgi:hypothetical protein
LKEETEDVEEQETIQEEAPVAEDIVEPAPPVPETKALPPPKDEPTPAPVQDVKVEATETSVKSPLDRVLDMDSPNAPEDDKPPHLQAPRYVHHFDTWSLVRDLQKGGFSQEQTITVMKAVRGLLGDNMNLARRALVSKSNVENVCFSASLFQRLLF